MNATSTKIEAATLSGSLVKALAEIGGAAKDKVNPHFKSKYADLASVVDAIKPVLAKHGLAFTQSTEPSETGVIVETFVWGGVSEFGGGPSKHSLGKLYVPANKQDAQGFGSALTYARRYSLMTAFGVPAEDDDGNLASRFDSRPATGETPPNKRSAGENFEPREVLEGPFTSGSALRGAIKAFATTLELTADLGEMSALLETPDFINLEKQALRYTPGWWDTGEGCPDNFDPMTSRIHRKKRALEQSENIHGTNILHAG